MREALLYSGRAGYIALATRMPNPGIVITRLPFSSARLVASFRLRAFNGWKVVFHNSGQFLNRRVPIHRHVAANTGS